MNPKPDSLIVRPLTFEQMSEAQREFYSPARSKQASEYASGEYDPIRRFDEEIAPFHR